MAYGLYMPRKIVPSGYLEPVRSAATKRTLVNVFGTPRARKWSVPAGGSKAGLRAAQLQHEIAMRLRDAIEASDAGNPSELVRRHDGITYDRLRGILSGDVWMRLEDVAELAAFLKVKPAISFEDR